MDNYYACRFKEDIQCTRCRNRNVNARVGRSVDLHLELLNSWKYVSEDLHTLLPGKLYK